MDATEGARISLPCPDPTAQSKRGSEARRTKEAEAAHAGGKAPVLVQLAEPLRFARLYLKPIARKCTTAVATGPKPLIGMILEVRGRFANLKRWFLSQAADRNDLGRQGALQQF